MLRPTDSRTHGRGSETITTRIGGRGAARRRSARSYWLLLPGKRASSAGLCLLPRGTEEGVRMVLSGRRFALKLGQAVRFNLLATAATARAGRPDCGADGDGWVELPPWPPCCQRPKAAALPRSRCSCKPA
jgi:hypothetical protein